MTMKCELCNNTASVAFFVLDKEEKIEKKFYLCEVCASKVPVSCFVVNQIQQPSRLKQFSIPKQTEENISGIFCSYCLTSAKDFLENGLLGCPRCYDSFSELIQDCISVKQLKLTHRGKMPIRLFQRKKLKKDIDQMRQIYQKCLEKENYEEAYGVARRLKRLESYLR